MNDLRDYGIIFLIGAITIIFLIYLD